MDDRATEVSWRPARAWPHEDAPWGGASAYREAVMTAATRASRLLLAADDLWSALPGALGVLAEAAGMDRLLLLVEGPIEGGARTGHRAVGEWTAPGIPGHAEAGLAEQANDDFPDLVARLHAGRPYWLHLEDVRGRGRMNLERLRIRTTTGFPLLAEGGYVGALVFDDCRARREYRPHEAEALEAAAGVIAAALHRDRLAEAVHGERERAALRRGALLDAVAHAAEALTATPDLRAGMAEAARVLGEATGVDRVNLFRYDHALGAGFVVADWSRAGIEPVSHFGTGPFGYADYEEVWRPLMAGEVYHAPTREKTGANAELNTRTATVTDLHVPVVVDGEFWGNLNFDDCAAERAWTDGEIEVLRAAAAAVAAAVRRERAEREHAEALARERESAAQQRAAEAEHLGALLQGVVAASRALLDEPSLEEGLRRWSGHLAAAMGADRAGVGIFERQGSRPCPVNLVDWAREGLRPLDGERIPRTSDFDAWSERLLRGEAVWAEYAGLADPASREYWDRTGCRANLIVPVMVDGGAWGWLYLDFATPRPGRPADVAVLRTAADGAAAAVKRDEALRAALEERSARERAEREHAEQVAREREDAARERAAELGRANDALRRTLSRWAHDEELETLATHALVEAAEQAGAYSNSLFLFDRAADTVRMTAAACAGQAVDIAEDPRYAVWRDPVRVAAGEYGWSDIEANRTIVHLEEMERDPRMWPSSIPWHRAMGHRSVVCVPLYVGAELFGFMGLGFREGEAVVRRRLELAQALAHQVALALRSTRLAAEAREAAVAREREGAALARAAELAKANEALRRAADELAGAATVEATLAVFLREAVAVAGAAAGAVLRRTGGHTFEFVAVLDGERLVAGDGLRAVAMAAAQRERSAGDPTGYFARLAAGETMFWKMGDLDTFHPEGAAWMRERGHRTAWDVPFVLRGEVAGYLGLAFRDEREPNPLVRETVASLASQVAVALEVIRLSDDAREAAVSREREAASRERAEEMARRNALLVTATEASRVLIDAATPYAAADEVLAMLGRGLGVDRAALGILAPDGDGGYWCELAHEWSSPGTPRQLDDPALRRTRLAGSAEDVARFRRGQPVQSVVHDLPEPSRGEQRATGALSQFALPVLLDGEPWGVLGFDDCTRARRWDAGEIAFLQVVAAALSAAVQRERVEREHRESVARERERAARERADELGRANAALSRSVARLSTHDDLQEFLTAVVREAVAASGAVTGSVFVHDPAGDTLRQTVLLLRGVVVDVGDPRNEAFGRPMPANTGEAWRIMSGRREVFWLDYSTPDPRDWPQSYDWHRAQGHRFVACVPMLLDGVAVGFLGLAFDRGVEVQPTEGRLALCRVLAQQATLALRLSRLAEQARDAAVAAEREAAAEERARELTSANAALRRAITGLAAAGSLDDFLAEMLAAALQVTGAQNGAVVLARGEWAEHRVLLERDRRVPREEQERDGTWRVPIHPGLRAALERTRSSGEVWSPPPEAALHTPGSREFHRARGNRAVRNVPMVVGERVVGWLALGFAEADPAADGRTELLRVLAEQMTAAVEMSRLADEARETAVAREQEAAARAHALELNRANHALQATIDALATADGLDEVVPIVLRIAATTFGSEAAGFYEQGADGVVYLRYWLHGDRVLRPAELLALDGVGGHATPRRLARGFTVPEAYLGGSPNRRTRAAVIDHAAGTVEPEFDDWTLRNGWPQELNVPCFVAGEAPHALVIYRGPQATFTPAEIALAEALAKQLALAAQTARLAAAARDHAVERAVAEEREAAVRERAAELARANLALRRSSERLVTLDDLDGFLAQVAGAAAESTGAAGAGVGLLAADGESLRLVALLDDSGPGGAFVQQAGLIPDIPLEGPFRRAWREIASAPGYWWAGPDDPGYTEESRAFHRSRGHEQIAHVPIRLRGEVIGFLGLCFRGDVRPRASRLEMLGVLAEQASLAIGMTRLADEARHAAVAREREQAARDRAAELARANEALRRGVERLSADRRVESLVGAFLAEAVDAVGARGGALMLRVPGTATTFRAEAVFDDGLLSPAQIAADPYLGRCVELSARDPGGIFGDLARGHTPSIRVDDLRDAVPEAYAYHAAHGDRIIWNAPLLLNGEVLGHAGLALATERLPGESARETVAALAQQLVLALELTRLAEEARAAAVAREREVAAEERAAELGRANDALQATVDAVASVDDVDELIPTVLRIVAGAFGARDCAYYEHPAGAPIRLRYWYLGGRVLHPEELAALDEERFGLVRRLAEGFTVPPEHLGVPFRARTRATVLDHTSAHTVPEFHHFAVSNGWGTELNVPLVVEGEADGALIIYRPAGSLFTDAEIALSEALAKQLALAVNARRLAEAARETAVAREREEAAQARVQELARANDALRRTTARLATEPRLDAYLGHLLLEACAQMRADAGHLTIYDAERHALVTAALVRDGALVPEEFPGEVRLEGESFFDLIVRERRPRSFDFGTGRHLFHPGTAEHREARGHTYALPLLVEGRPLGHIGIATRGEGPLVEEQLAFLEALAQHAALAIQLTRLANEARDAAVAREREQAARGRAAELARANEALRRGVERLSADRRVESLVGAFLAESVEAVGARGGSVMLRVPGTATTFRPEAVFEGGPLSREQIEADPYLGRYLEFSAGDPGEIFSGLARGETPSIRVDDLRHAFPPAYRYHAARGDRVIWHAPLRLNGEVLGFTGLALTADRLPGESARETVAALAQQLVLALELTRLAEEARDAAVAREREVAAEQRAAELGRANDALRRGVERLVEARSIDAIRDVFVLEAIRASGASAGALLRRVGETEFEFATVADRAGVVGPAYAAEHVASMREVSRRDPAGFFARLAAGEHVLSRVDELAGWYPEAAEFHRAQGNDAVWNIPFTAGGEVAGYLGLSFPAQAAPDRVVLETLRALASQASMALETARLAEEAREAAVAREREIAAEERAGELARANAALSSAVISTAEDTDFAAVLGRCVASVVEVSGACYGQLFRYDAGLNTLDSAFWVEDSVLHEGYDPGAPPILRHAFDADVTPAFRAYVESRDIMTADLRRADPALLAAAWPGLVDWHLEHGRGWSCAIPVLAGPLALGMLGLAWREPVSFSAAQRELLFALASQTALVMQLAELASATREAAVAREQERAARERVEELAKANEALRAGVDEMAGSGTVPGILTAFLRQAVRATGADAGAVLLRAGSTTRFDLTAVIAAGGAAHATGDPDHPLAREIREASAADRTGYFAALARGEMQWRAVDSALAAHLPRVAEFHARAGRRAIWDVPFAIRGEVRGYLSVVFTQQSRPPPVVTEAVAALATQVGLALELTRLADEARESAVARERELAAEERAAELGRANEVVRGTLSTLAEGRSVDAFVASVLEESVRQTGALDSALYLYDADADTLRMAAACLRDAPDAHEIAFHVPMPAAHAGAWRVIVDAPSPLLVHPVEDPLTWPHTLATHRALGHASLGYFLVRAGERPLGFVGLAWAEAEPKLPPERLEVVAALVQQLALALELDRLARQGRHAAVLEERTRLAREIHDTLAHGLAGIAVTLEGARGILMRDPARGVAHVDTALALARESLADARHALHTLRPVGSTRVGLGDALQQLAARFNGHNGTAVRVEAQEMPLPLSEEAEVELLRIAQEAVSNAVRHARARWARVTLEASDDGGISLRVSDDGRGFDLTALEPAHMVGITGMRERAARVGGVLAVLSRPGEGTDVVVIVPSRATGPRS